MSNKSLCLDLAKFVIYLANFLYLVIGLSIISFSLYFYIDTNSRRANNFVFDLLYYSFADNYINLSVFIWLFLPLGLLLFFYGIFSCSSVYRNKRVSLSVILALNFAITLGVIAYFILQYGVQNVFTPLSDVVKNFLTDFELDRFEMGDRLYNEFQTYQQENKCCGLGVDDGDLIEPKTSNIPFNSISWASNNKNKDNLSIFQSDYCYNWISGVPIGCSCDNEVETEIILNDLCTNFPPRCSYETNSTIPFNTVYKNSCTDSLYNDIDAYLFIGLYAVIAIGAVCSISTISLLFIICFENYC